MTKLHPTHLLLLTLIGFCAVAVASHAFGQMQQQRPMNAQQQQPRPVQQDIQQRLSDINAQVRAINDKIQEQQHGKAPPSVGSASVK